MLDAAISVIRLHQALTDTAEEEKSFEAWCAANYLPNEYKEYARKKWDAAMVSERNRTASEQVVMEKQIDAAGQAELAKARDILSRVFIPDADFSDKPLPKCLQPFSGDGNETASKAGELPACWEERPLLEVIGKMEALKPGMSEAYGMGISDCIAVLRNHRAAELEKAFAKDARRIIRTPPVLEKAIEAASVHFREYAEAHKRSSVDALCAVNHIIEAYEQALQPASQDGLDDEELLHIAVQAFSAKQPEDMRFAEDAVQAVIDAVRPYLAAPSTMPSALSEPALERAALLCGANMSKAFAIAHTREIVLAYLDAARSAAGEEP